MKILRFIWWGLKKKDSLWVILIILVGAGVIGTTFVVLFIVTGGWSVPAIVVLLVCWFSPKMWRDAKTDYKDYKEWKGE